MKKLLLILGLIGFAFTPGLRGQTPEPVVHAILFYSPTCGHCHQLITEYLMPLEEELGNGLVLLGMDTSQSWGNNLYWETIRHFELPEEDWVVPMMVVGDEVLIGGLRIPSRLDEILEERLAGNAVDLPSYPAMVEFFREQNILDPRYPDRLIARTAPPSEGEASPQEEVPEPEAESAPDSLETEPSPVEEETADTVSATEDSAAAPPPPVDSAAAVAVEAAPDPEGVSEDPPPGELTTPVQPEDSAAVEPAEEEEVSGPPAPVEVDRPAADTEALPPAGSAVSLPSDSATPPGSEAVSGLGLGEAVQGMETMTMMDRFNLDPVGNSISVLVLIVMLISLILRGYPPRVRGGAWPSWVIPCLVMVGVGVAAYLSYIEVTHSEAVCGPVGDCNTVNQSEYATLFGVLPVGILGLLGYGLILVLWALRYLGSDGVGKLSTIGLWASALFGTAFSIYLTFLEPFVIGATCAWCLTSAVIMTLLLWVTSPMAARVWSNSDPPSAVS